MANEYLTQAEAARRLGVSRAAIHMAVARNSLKPYLRTVDGTSVFTADEVERYRLVSLGRPGRPRKASV